MPAKNSLKQYQEEAYYHIYNRGVEKRIIFMEDKDYGVFLHILKRHLSKVKQKDQYGRQYESYRGRVELLAFCLMPNHFHLMFYLGKDITSIAELMRKVASSYTNYFNTKYQRVGHLFQGVYKATHINNDSYLQHVSRYIHLNPGDYKDWRFSSYRYYIGEWSADWVVTDRILEIFNNNQQEYKDFTADYLSHKQILADLKHELADC